MADVCVLGQTPGAPLALLARVLELHWVLVPGCRHGREGEHPGHPSAPTASAPRSLRRLSERLRRDGLSVCPLGPRPCLSTSGLRVKGISGKGCETACAVEFVQG